MLADELEKTDPRSASVIRTDFFMDDFITGTDTLEEAVSLNRQIFDILASAKFPLCKYISNSQRFLKSIDASLIEKNEYHDFDVENVKVLGIHWSPNIDKLSVQLDFDPSPGELTKRKLLLEIARIFDVIGVISPITIRDKLLMQQLWQLKLGWDNNVPADLKIKFNEYKSELIKINSFSIDRHYALYLCEKPFELTGFCDASSCAYCVVVYVRVQNRDHNFKVSFVCAKTKVASLKPLSVPRLELQAAHLLSQLLVKIEKILGNNCLRKHAFSYSQVVLCWLNKPPETWTTFVASSTWDICWNIPASQWHYVGSKDNPVDLATRGISTETFLNSQRWLGGPTFMQSTSSPSYVGDVVDGALEEAKKQKFSMATSLQPADISILDRFSSYSRLVASFAYVRRFLHHSKPKTVDLEPTERIQAKFAIVRLIQRHYYSREMLALKANTEVHKLSCLFALSSFLDENDVIRVGG